MEVSTKMEKNVCSCRLSVCDPYPSGVMAQGLTIRIEKGSLDKAFQLIMKSSNIQLVYNTNVASKIPCTATVFENKEITTILNTLLEGTELAWYRGENDIYIITERREQPSQQIGKVSGRVVDKGGEPLIGVTVVIKGTSTGAATDVDGNFTINGLRDSSVVIVVSYIGKESKEVTAKLNAHVLVTLEDDASEIEEVVVTGYQSISREKVTGSASTVTSDDLSRRHTTNIMDNLEGRVARIGELRR